MPKRNQPEKKDEITLEIPRHLRTQFMKLHWAKQSMIKKAWVKDINYVFIKESHIFPWSSMAVYYNRVKITSYRKKLIRDWDNMVISFCKQINDTLIRAGLIRDDSMKDIKTEVYQEVDRKRYPLTVIKLWRE